MIGLFFSAMCLIASLILVLTMGIPVMIKGILLVCLAIFAWVTRESVAEDKMANTIANIETIFSGVCGALYVFAGVLNILIFGF